MRISFMQLLFACLWIAQSSAANAGMVNVLAERSITGKITDEKGEGLPSVSIVLKGTQRGTTTDLEGKYTIVVPDGLQH